MEVGGLRGFRWPVAVWEVWLLAVVGLPAYRKCPLPLPTPSLPIKAANVSLWLIMRYTSRAVYLQDSETPLCINRAPIHSVGGDVFTNLSTDRDVDIRRKLWVKFSWSWRFWQFICRCISQQINIFVFHFWPVCCSCDMISEYVGTQLCTKCLIQWFKTAYNLLIFNQMFFNLQLNQWSKVSKWIPTK